MSETEIPTETIVQEPVIQEPIPETVNPNSFTYETPIEKVMTYNIKSCIFNVLNIVVNQSCEVNVICITDNDVQIRACTLKMEGQDYLDWGNDDEYLINWIKQKIIELP